MEPREEENSPQEEEIAAAIALLLGGLVAVATIEALIERVASLLSLLPGLPQSDADGSVTRRVARLVVQERPALTGQSRSATSRATHIDNLLHRAHYAINATKRIATSEDIRKGFAKERRFYTAHREAERRRLAGARMVEAAIELHGPVLGWKHGHPKEPRPSHARADGMNFDGRRVPLSTGALPGVLPNCTCTVAAPFENARVLR